MNQKDLLLVGGGLVAGFVICKMMNRTSNTESFSANGGIAMSEKPYRWNGIGTPLTERGNVYLPQVVNISNESFSLTGNIKVLRPVLLANGSFDTSKWEVSPTGMYGEKYIESTLTKTNGSVISRLWFPYNALIKNVKTK